MPSSKLLSFLAILLSSSAEGMNVAQPISQHLQERASYNGGWAIGLSGSTCPSDTPVACDTNGGYVNPTCCPTDQKCFGYASPYCCPSNTDCLNVVTNFPLCANSTWSMYVYNSNRNLYFCCPPGQFGVLPISGNAGICQPDDTFVESSLIATLATQAGGVVKPTAPTTGVKRTSTAVVTSTRDDGVVETVTTEVAAQSTSYPSEIETSDAGAEETSSPSSSDSTSNPNPKSKSKKPLPIGAIAGIAIGAVLFLAITLFSIWLKRKNHKNQKTQNEYPPGGQQGLEVYVGGTAHGNAPAYNTGGFADGTQREFKSPATGGESMVHVVGGDGFVTPPQGYHGAGYSTPPPPLGQRGYSHTSPPRGGYGSGNEVVEVPAPGRWEMGVGR